MLTRPLLARLMMLLLLLLLTRLLLTRPLVLNAERAWQLVAACALAAIHRQHYLERSNPRHQPGCHARLMPPVACLFL